MEGGWEVIPGVRFGGCGDGDGAALELCLRLEVPRRNPSRCQPRLRRARRRGGGGGGGGRKSPVRLQLPPQALPRCSVPAPGPPPALPAARTPAAARAEPLPRGEPRATVAPHRGRESPFGAGRRRTKRLRGGGGSNRTKWLFMLIHSSPATNALGDWIPSRGGRGSPKSAPTSCALSVHGTSAPGCNQ